MKSIGKLIVILKMSEISRKIDSRSLKLSEIDGEINSHSLKLSEISREIVLFLL